MPEQCSPVRCYPYKKITFSHVQQDDEEFSTVFTKRKIDEDKTEERSERWNYVDNEHAVFKSDFSLGFSSGTYTRPLILKIYAYSKSVKDSWANAHVH